ncbi:hypothetical protein D9758_001408 [Tetrapyrgos nigripes]|uniref:Uncharacterized protein n=1 Tax=Tetrapyrgos nigripes TaxID=182062 RepID=A0A8H5GSG6_9AGAR|nr:hypothetical protein D9758_001408 [Tetrapyrgos nigripes]
MGITMSICAALPALLAPVTACFQSLTDLLTYVAVVYSTPSHGAHYIAFDRRAHDTKQKKHETKQKVEGGEGGDTGGSGGGQQPQVVVVKEGGDNGVVTNFIVNTSEGGNQQNEK